MASVAATTTGKDGPKESAVAERAANTGTSTSTDDNDNDNATTASASASASASTPGEQEQVEEEEEEEPYITLIVPLVNPDSSSSRARRRRRVQQQGTSNRIATTQEESLEVDVPGLHGRNTQAVLQDLVRTCQSRKWPSAFRVLEHPRARAVVTRDCMLAFARAVARVDRSRPHSTEADIVYDALNVLAACVTLGGASQASVLLDTQKLRSQFDKHAFARRAVQECGDVEDPGSTRRVVVLVIVAAALVFINWVLYATRNGIPVFFGLLSSTSPSPSSSEPSASAASIEPSSSGGDTVP